MILGYTISEISYRSVVSKEPVHKRWNIGNQVYFPQRFKINYFVHIVHALFDKTPFENCYMDNYSNHELPL